MFGNLTFFLCYRTVVISLCLLLYIFRAITRYIKFILLQFLYLSLFRSKSSVCLQKLLNFFIQILRKQNMLYVKFCYFQIILLAEVVFKTKPFLSNFNGLCMFWCFHEKTNAVEHQKKLTIITISFTDFRSKSPSNGCDFIGVNGFFRKVLRFLPPKRSKAPLLYYYNGHVFAYIVSVPVWNQETGVSFWKKGRSFSFISRASVPRTPKNTARTQLKWRKFNARVLSRISLATF